MRRVAVEGAEVIRDIGREAHLGGLHGVGRRGAGRGDVGADLGSPRAELHLVLARGLVRALGAGITAAPGQVIVGNGQLREGEVEQRLAVGAKANLASLAQHLAVVHEALEVHGALVALLLARERRGEVEVDAGEFAGGKHLGDAHGAARHEDDVGKAALVARLRSVGHADRFGVHADEEHARLALGHLHREGAVAAAQVEPHLAEGLLAHRRARPRPLALPGVGVRLQGVGIALEALLEHKVLRQTDVQATHGTPCWFDKSPNHFARTNAGHDHPPAKDSKSIQPPSSTS